MWSSLRRRARDAVTMSALAPLGLSVFHHHVGRGLISIVLLSLASAACYGVAAVLQHQAAIREPPGLSMRSGLLVRLVRRPRWLVGNALDGVGYLFQFLALRRGSLALVEPLLMLSLVFALPISAWLDHQRISASAWAATGATAAGLALFLQTANPGLGHPNASARAWTILTVVIVALCTAAVVARRGTSSRRSIAGRWLGHRLWLRGRAHRADRPPSRCRGGARAVHVGAVRTGHWGGRVLGAHPARISCRRAAPIPPHLDGGTAPRGRRHRPRTFWRAHRLAGPGPAVRGARPGDGGGQCVCARPVVGDGGPTRSDVNGPRANEGPSSEPHEHRRTEMLVAQSPAPAGEPPATS